VGHGKCQEKKKKKEKEGESGFILSTSGQRVIKASPRGKRLTSRRRERGIFTSDGFRGGGKEGGKPGEKKKIGFF